MPSLMDVISQNMVQPEAPLQTQSNTEKARNLFAARSGKAVTPGQGPAVDNSAEQIAGTQTKQQLRDVQTAGNVAQQQLGAEDRRLQQQEQAGLGEVELRRQQLVQGNQQRKAELLQKMNQEAQSLQLDKSKSQQEQLAQLLRLEDKKYIDIIEMQGNKQRLNTEIGRKESLLRSTLGDSTDLLRKQLGQNDILAMDARVVKERLANMDLNLAISLAASDAAAARTAGQISAAQGTFNAGTAAYGSQQEGKFSADYQRYKDNGGTKSYQGYQNEQDAGFVGPPASAAGPEG